MNDGLFSRPARRWLCVFVLGGVVGLMPRPGLAQPVPDVPYLRLQRLSEELDDLAQQARASARRSADRALFVRIDHFASRTRDFRERVEDRHISARRIDAELRRLIDDAGKLQRAVGARVDGANAYAYGDWNRLMNVLTRMNGEYRADLGFAPAPPAVLVPVPPPAPAVVPAPTPAVVGTTGSLPIAVARETQPLVPADPAEFQALADELNDRAARAARWSDGSNYDDLRPRLEQFASTASYLDLRAGRLATADVRTTIADLLQTAVRTEDDLRHRNIDPEVQGNWTRIVDVLTSMRDLASQGVTGTAGAVVPRPTDSDGYVIESNDPTALLADLDNRLAEATNLAARTGNDDVSHPVRRFTDQLRDYERRYSGQPRSAENRAALDGLVKDAQDTQVDLAQRGVPESLIAAWNGIVNELVRLRNGR